MTASIQRTEHLFGRHRAIIGMVHLLPLPGAPSAAAMERVREHALADARALLAGGVDAILVENFGDAPFYKDDVPAVTVAAMAVVVDEVRRRCRPLPVGVNVLRNDARSALAIAAATGASFIRVNVLTGAMLTDQGIVEGRAAEVARLRRELGLEGSVAILADVLVKHAAPLAPMTLAQVVADTVERGGADAIVVSGAATGAATPMALIEGAKAHAGACPVIVGSGVGIGNVASILRIADAAIVGTSLKREGRVHGAVDEARVRELVHASHAG
jgi:membrane complex biogenesis BtpA family protein